jgi:DNA-binding NarL/FixJ family response regulator
VTKGLLTPRQVEVLELIANEGLAVPEIAARLGIARDTVRTHVERVLLRTETHSQVEATVWAWRHGSIYHANGERRISLGETRGAL